MFSVLLAVMGMGGRNSLAFAQEVHLGVLAATGVDLKSMLAWGEPLPNLDVFTGVFLR